MPTFKHPCPHCGTFIERDVVACPKCGTRDPFSPGRCPNCSAPLDDASWIACPKCGNPVGAALAAQQAQAASAAPGAVPGWGQQAPAASPIPGWGQQAPAAPPAPTAEPAPADPAPRTSTCRACGSPLAEGARFCKDCGTAAS
ncbi:MAG: zinc ribbon domain-containing protein [Candidatus Limnocylindrales bacterium]